MREWSEAFQDLRASIDSLKNLDAEEDSTSSSVSTSKWRFSKRSLRNMHGLHPHLLIVLNEAIQVSPLDFIVTSGYRSTKKQRALVEKGASKTMNSRHLTGHAFDIAALVDGQVSWAWPPYTTLAECFLGIANKHDIALEWGGNWRGKWKDGPHFQLSWSKHPKNEQWAGKVKNYLEEEYK